MSYTLYASIAVVKRRLARLTPCDFRQHLKTWGMFKQIPLYIGLGMFAPDYR